jgi:hypothetical protein
MFTTRKIAHLVKNKRTEAYNSDKFNAIELMYGKKVAKEAFLAFHVTWSDHKGQQRIMGFAFPPSVSALKNENLQMHFDGTFKMTPRGFMQVCILSIIDKSSKKHLPVYYCLLTTKTQKAYEIMFYHIKMSVGECWLYPINIYQPNQSVAQ